MATMPVRSVLKNNDKLNFDEIESCKISGMSSSIKEASGEEGSQEDMNAVAQQVINSNK